MSLLDAQLQVLAGKGYPDDALDAVASLRSVAPDEPFVAVVTSALMPTVEAVERWDVRGKKGWTDMHDELGGFTDSVDVPGPAYLLVGWDTGADSLGVAPKDALPRVLAAGRSPLTIDEGVALVTHHPELFKERNAFQALASRAPNKRIPSFWISKGAPRLGWCWEGNPHSWLGAGSATDRVG